MSPYDIYFALSVVGGHHHSQLKMKMKLLCGDYFTTYSYVNSTESSESSQNKITKGHKGERREEDARELRSIQQTSSSVPS